MLTRARRRGQTKLIHIKKDAIIRDSCIQNKRSALKIHLIQFVLLCIIQTLAFDAKKNLCCSTLPDGKHTDTVFSRTFWVPR